MIHNFKITWDNKLISWYIDDYYFEYCLRHISASFTIIGSQVIINRCLIELIPNGNGFYRL